MGRIKVPCFVTGETGVANLTFASAALQAIERRSRAKYGSAVNWWLVARAFLVLTFLQGAVTEFETLAAGDKIRARQHFVGDNRDAESER